MHVRQEREALHPAFSASVAEQNHRSPAATSMTVLS